jgi:hypothetical protein
MLKRQIVSRNLHKWLSLFVGLQLVVWLLSGLYMVAVNIEFIHGDPLVRNTQQAITLPGASGGGFAMLRERYPEATRIGLQPVMGKTHYLVRTPALQFLVDPETGARKKPFDQAAAKAIASFHYNGGGEIAAAILLSDNPPTELGKRALPLWRIDFDDRFDTSFYVDPDSGKLVTRRHRYWRVFDFLWMLHIMDYETRSDSHSPLLIFFESAGLVLFFSGVWLLFYSFARSRGKRERDR